MPKDPNKKRLSPDLTPEEYRDFHAEAVKLEWSDKKLCEIIIRSFLRSADKQELLSKGKGPYR